MITCGTCKRPADEELIAPDVILHIPFYDMNRIQPSRGDVLLVFEKDSSGLFRPWRYHTLNEKTYETIKKTTKYWAPFPQKDLEALLGDPIPREKEPDITVSDPNEPFKQAARGDL